MENSMKKFRISVAKIWILLIVFMIVTISSGVISQVKSGSEREINIQLPKNVYFQDGNVYIFLKSVDYGDLVELFNQIQVLSYKKIVIDLFSFGGNVFDALAIAALFEDQQRMNKIVEIRARGIIASAGLIIMMSGSPGYRFIDKLSWVMFHEMSSFKFFAIESVSDQEEQAKINRKIQDSINAYITVKTKITPEKLSELIKKKELWCTAEEAVGLGFADKIIGK
jgi:ATP-dependent protease ClpP protease subunit